MKIISSFICLFFILFIFQIYGANYTQKIQWLYQRLQKKFWTQNQPYKNPKHAAHMKGLYQSQIKINFIDKKNGYFSEFMRKNSLDDNNMFVTSFVLYSLLETSQLGTISLDEHAFSMALQAIAQFRDKNTDYGIPQYNFWPQNLVNGTWIAQPTNLLNVANIIPSPDSLSKPFLFLMEKLGLQIIFAMKDLVNVFTIPADNDDSGVNLALLGLLKQTNSSHFDFWNSFNFNKQEYYKRVLKYAYRPFDNNFTKNKFANQIDPRIYYLYHEFFEMKKNESLARNQTPSLILPTTWLLNYEQQINGLIRMPFSNNNVDSTVCANVLFGISSLALNGLLDLQRVPGLNQLVQNTADLLQFIIKNKIATRPDLALVYYPSKYDFFWFVSRLNNLYKRKSSIFQPFSSVYEKLNRVMKNQGTKIIINSAQKTKNSSQIYWSQFLGNYGGKLRNQDAIFSTSLALNALLDTWSTRSGNKIKYDDDMTNQIHQTIQKGINYLNSHIKPKMKESNAFFSGSWKSDETNPYIYPANIHLDKNKKNIDPQTSTFNDIHTGMNYLMKGFIEAQQYENLLKSKWFGYDVPTQFKGFNQQPFPFWSAEPITQVMAISVLSKYMRCEEDRIIRQRQLLS